MITLRFSPEWFYGIDSIFEILAVIITFFIGVYSYKLYRFSGNYRYKYLSLSFLAFTLSFLAKIATNFVIYFHKEVKETLGDMIVKTNLVQQSNIFLQKDKEKERVISLLLVLSS